jgi:hypothetical protein
MMIMNLPTEDLPWVTFSSSKVESCGDKVLKLKSVSMGVIVGDPPERRDEYREIRRRTKHPQKIYFEGPFVLSGEIFVLSIEISTVRCIDKFEVYLPVLIFPFFVESE